ncbi:MAG: hypothetical protein A2186_01210 [Candidatus Levybacteria bacterium RIFOXYA1_FULL_41_10]|nr:MAG: Phosphoesterase RecJ domain protein [Candidatus Levybacteria bacterium GW2011_GWA1_39_32]KKR51428.1 MAG: Phosphoesterase RecJ domain protein [Candidatus Levybacteria bacterium GW2011_GWC1_40_19]KKR73231.1 MAG: Phosphoesterase RecJ domain protein [Candidatus Levybacteria bacterium GW2011_GWC2_40_7]KKR94874.1 MAG: Phosphoesterase RecJ domain protein [Candidatus Levybacteria bacterium GW2011_GWA2_41_15]KKS00876.1 MAG: Phosphoesterase RecJ domain protein [Candidatus Levybacteria bacterium G
MNNLDKVIEALNKGEPIAVAVGQNYGLDEIAAALGLYLTLFDSGKDVSIASPTSPLVEVSNLVGIDKVKGNFVNGKGGDLVVSFPYKNDEIDKVSYTLEEGFLNIIVKGKDEQLSFGEKDVIFKNTSKAPSLLFVVGTPRISDLGRLFDAEAMKDTMVVNIDNKPDNQGYGDVVVVSPTASSVSEQVGDLILGLGLRLDPDSSQNLMSGISYATNDFASDRTTPLAFEIASILMRNGARRNRTHTVQEERPVAEERVVGERTFDIKRVERKVQNPPKEWLTPKIYKGSTNVE